MKLSAIEKVQLYIDKFFDTRKNSKLNIVYKYLKRTVKGVMIAYYLNTVRSDEEIDFIAHTVATDLVVSILTKSKPKKMNISFLKSYVKSYLYNVYGSDALQIHCSFISDKQVVSEEHIGTIKKKKGLFYVCKGKKVLKGPFNDKDEAIKGRRKIKKMQKVDFNEYEEQLHDDRNISKSLEDYLTLESLLKYIYEKAIYICPLSFNLRGQVANLVITSRFMDGVDVTKVKNGTMILALSHRIYSNLNEKKSC